MLENRIFGWVSYLDEDVVGCGIFIVGMIIDDHVEEGLEDVDKEVPDLPG